MPRKPACRCPVRKFNFTLNTSISTQPQLQAQLQSAQSDWLTKGFKAEVEQARQVECSCIARSPSFQWAAWQAQCVGDIDLLTDLQNRPFGPTLFSPYDLLEQPDWPVCSLTNAEIHSLRARRRRSLGTPWGPARQSKTRLALVRIL